MSFFIELKRRNVFRVAFAYLITAWLVLQVSQLVLETIEAPAWVLKVFLLLFAMGLPLALLFSWAYELTPEGLKKEKDVNRTQSVTPDTGRKLDQITIAIAVVLVIFIAVDRIYLSSSVRQVPESASDSVEIADKSIAVLAFEDLSPDGDQEYFADGLSEELLNVLAQIPDLQVAGRTSSFAFKGQNRDLREIGEVLNVAHILEGSVRKAGNRIRVTAQLINATTGFHLYSESYDRDLTDVFAVQDEIAAAISTALRAKLIGADKQQAAETSIEAYDLYLIARQKIYSRNKEKMEDASGLLDQALEIDADYAPALAQKALVMILLSDGIGSYGDIPEDEAAVIARALVDKAISIDENLAEAHAISALVMESEKDPDWDEMTEIFQYALSLNPNLDNARVWLARAYDFAGRRAEGRALYESIVEHDPAFGVAFNNLTYDYLRTADLDMANTLIGRFERIVGETSDVHQARGAVALVQGESARAIRHLRRVYDDNPSSSINLFWYAGALGSVGEFETIVDVGHAVDKIFALGTLGRHEEARALLETLDPVVDASGILGTAAYYFMVEGQYEEAVAYAERHFGSLDVLMERFASPDGENSGYMAPLAFSYLQVGKEDEFLKLTQAMAETAEQKRAVGTNDMSLRFREMNLAALTGKDEEALEHMQSIVDNGLVDVLPFDSPIYARFYENLEFQKLRATVVKRANDERAKLGLDPYLPAMASN
jgi:TolB-like protein